MYICLLGRKEAIILGRWLLLLLTALVSCLDVVYAQLERLDIPELEPLWSYKTNGMVNSVYISSDDRYVVAGNLNNVYLFNKDGLLWNYDTGVRYVSMSSDGRYMVAGSGKSVYFFDRNGNLLWRNSADGVVWSVVISSGGKNVAAGSGNKVLFYNATPMLAVPKATSEITPTLEEDKPIPRFEGLLVVIALTVCVLWREKL